MNKIILLAIGLVAWQLTTQAQRTYPPVIDNAEVVTYKSVDGVDLKLWIFNPPQHKSTDKTPAAVFFFGGGWNGGSPGQFVPHCEYLASRGMVAMVADYRVRSRHNVLANKCVADAKSAVRWIRKNAAELGVDPDRIVASGGSAGGHLAASTATLPGLDEPDEDLNISSKPNACVLFNPVLVLASIDSKDADFNKEMQSREARLGVDPVSISPYHNITKGMPPTLIFHGTGDTTVPYESAVLFAKKMKEKGNRCRLVGYKGEPHGFFNHGRKANGPFIDTVNKMDKFLSRMGYIQAPPEISN